MCISSGGHAWNKRRISVQRQSPSSGVETSSGWGGSGFDMIRLGNRGFACVERLQSLGCFLLSAPSAHACLPLLIYCRPLISLIIQSEGEWAHYKSYHSSLAFSAPASGGETTIKACCLSNIFLYGPDLRVQLDLCQGVKVSKSQPVLIQNPSLVSPPIFQKCNKISLSH